MDDLIYRIIKSAMRLLALIPQSVMDRLANVIGRLWFSMDAYHRTIALDNMAIAFGETDSTDKRRQMVRDNFVQLSRAALALPRLMRLTPENVNQYATFSGETNVRKAIAKGKGLIFLSAHFGNWELMNMATAVRFGQVYILARRLDFPAMDRLLTEIRSSTGSIILDKNGSADLLRELLRSARMVGILLDQNASWFEGVFVRFFGRPACTNKGLAMFALRYDTPIVPAYNVRMPDGRYRIVFEPELTLVKTGNVRHDILKNTALFNQTMENMIRKAPDHWFWVHRRWRFIGVPERARDKMLIDDGIELDLSQ